METKFSSTKIGNLLVHQLKTKAQNSINTGLGSKEIANCVDLRVVIIAFDATLLVS